MIEMGNKNKPEGIMEDKATKNQMEILKKHFAAVNLNKEENIKKLEKLLKKCPQALLEQLADSRINHLAHYANLERMGRQEKLEKAFICGLGKDI